MSVPTGSEAANEAGEETEEEGVEEGPPVDIDADIYRDGDGEASYLVLPGCGQPAPYSRQCGLLQPCPRLS